MQKQGRGTLGGGDVNSALTTMQVDDVVLNPEEEVGQGKVSLPKGLGPKVGTYKKRPRSSDKQGVAMVQQVGTRKRSLSDEENELEEEKKKRATKYSPEAGLLEQPCNDQ